MFVSIPNWTRRSGKLVSRVFRTDCVSESQESETMKKTHVTSYTATSRRSMLRMRRDCKQRLLRMHRGRTSWHGLGGVRFCWLAYEWKSTVQSSFPGYSDFVLTFGLAWSESGSCVWPWTSIECVWEDYFLLKCHGLLRDKGCIIWDSTISSFPVILSSSFWQFSVLKPSSDGQDPLSTALPSWCSSS